MAGDRILSQVVQDPIYTLDSERAQYTLASGTCSAVRYVYPSQVGHKPGPATSDTCARCDLGLMVSHLFVMCLCAYADILGTLALVSRLSQLCYITYAVMSSAIRDLIAALQATYLSG